MNLPRPCPRPRRPPRYKNPGFSVFYRRREGILALDGNSLQRFTTFSVSVCFPLSVWLPPHFSASFLYTFFFFFLPVLSHLHFLSSFCHLLATLFFHRVLPPFFLSSAFCFVFTLNFFDFPLVFLSTHIFFSFLPSPLPSPSTFRKSFEIPPQTEPFPPLCLLSFRSLPCLLFFQFPFLPPPPLPSSHPFTFRKS